jgi:hypothetical protein
MRASRGRINPLAYRFAHIATMRASARMLPSAIAAKRVQPRLSSRRRMAKRRGKQADVGSSPGRAVSLEW